MSRKLRHYRPSKHNIKIIRHQNHFHAFTIPKKPDGTKEDVETFRAAMHEFESLSDEAPFDTYLVKSARVESLYETVSPRQRRKIIRQVMNKIEREQIGVKGSLLNALVFATIVSMTIASLRTSVWTIIACALCVSALFIFHYYVDKKERND